MASSRTKNNNGYVWLMEALTIFNKYIGYEPDGVVLGLNPVSQPHGEQWLICGVDKRHMREADIDRLTELGWSFDEPNSGYWGLSRTTLDAKQVEQDIT